MARRMNKDTKKDNKKLEDFCALWEQESKNGNTYLSGKDRDGNRLVAFYNDNKKNPKEPDIRVYYSDEDDE